MTNHKENSGNAFPAYLGNKENWDMGMSLRYWFAGQALTGLIPAYTAAYGSPTSNVPEIVTEAYHYADAMLEARSTKK